MKKNLGYLLLVAVILAGCSNDEDNKVEADTVESSNPGKEKQANIIEGLELATTENNIIKFAQFIEKAKDDELVNQGIIDMSDSFLKNLLDEKDYKTFRVNNKEVHMINSISIDNKDIHKPILTEETKLKLDEMKQAIIDRNFARVDSIYNEGILIDHVEASAMYAYATYLQTEPKSQEASAILGIAVDPKYKGRFRDEIVEGITDTSYLAANPGQIAFIETDWKYIESLYEDFKETEDFYEQNKAEGEAERAAAVGQNPTIGMTAG
ncbi:hypothetical protein [Planococcus sp. ISL-109]|uniref:hypothetical protein n=1 Tax=Planococcus sp. ISL-109 TaxID=2819166 RepID=UPI001BE4FC25|nr:hypothetical protein [Planococcus sp. ISL-109]MBT2582820.1 hypothetical protein [Planococcus sp. ISL-109]